MKKKITTTIPKFEGRIVGRMTTKEMVPEKIITRNKRAEGQTKGCRRFEQTYY
jgi:hypothetical protein